MTTATTAPKTVMQRLLDGVEKVGNMVPHPVIIFLILIGIVIVLSAVLSAFGAAVSYERINPDTHEIETASTAIRSLLNVEGIRFLYSSLIPNFMSFTAVGLMIAAMIGAGVAEESGLVTALIRKLVIVSPRWALTYILAFVGILASIAADAGYLVLIPLAGVAYLAVGRHPLAGLALGFAAVAGAFTVNMLIKPLDAVLVEFTNDAARLVDPERSIGLASNVWFSIASVIFLTFIIAFITDRMISPRLGDYKPEASSAGSDPDQGATLSEQESRGLRFAFYGLAGLVLVFLLLTIPSGAPLRNPETGELIGNSPFMNGLIALIMLIFLVTGWTYGIGAGTLRTLTEVIAAIEKSIKNMGGTIFLFFVLSQFVACFTYTNIGTVMALSLSGALQAANIGALPLLIGFIVVVAIIDLLLTGAIAKWAIFAPVFVPLLMKLGVEPEAVLAAYRVGDSPMNAITPLNAYFALVVGFAQKYDKSAGVGTIVSLMLPYVVLMFVLWTALFAVWKALGLPWGL
ncbi:AbgT family transporter [Phyllobacterium endophyticum]|uniref:p-aminobenzoyl-glutamate transporter n=1 Tax=Phyllobacterium endophyticum TaxID=1149773 RepID=A0A2P7AL20_9HYPH|nr:AbgT family transporter [Phyllobacterium endophyticum]MBB3233197.1 aminobenzoyl-glutamate transport protein [Phyllobacterium endophyticum]PSH54907.1 p-aminobenzoyl-glutamate transporter [Phyllobacterium endophyticum]TYR43217.1 AbgT family transporter [Phyllobacterium endophyticum]